MLFYTSFWLQCNNMMKDLLLCKKNYNIYQKFIKTWLDRCTPLKALLDDFTCQSYQITYKTINHRTIIYIFFAYHILIKFIYLNQKIMLIDTNYKINKYWMQFLYVIRCTTFNSSFIVALIFMALKEIRFYKIVLKWIKKIIC